MELTLHIVTFFYNYYKLIKIHNYHTFKVKFIYKIPNLVNIVKIFKQSQFLKNFKSVCFNMQFPHCLFGLKTFYNLFISVLRNLFQF